MPYDYHDNVDIEHLLLECGRRRDELIDLFRRQRNNDPTLTDADFDREEEHVRFFDAVTWDLFCRVTGLDEARE